MKHVVCDLYICNYLDKKTHIACWRDVDNKSLIKRAEELRKTLLNLTPNVEIKYETKEDDAFGGRMFYTATIIVE